ncbi:ABC transporter ATP-binding protein [Vallitalea okinawensis]|uniref:ABC transporter ATP-binding protein n=1 Tax=Vallitalea okinawensis TaxID=2078660 RepID=UPI000CFB8372|nr:ABC transporter ATP-binding protein [Vallitalea okinawensis]
MSYILQTYNLTKVYDDKEVVSNVNMKVKSGEIYGFLGPNGAGKTTVMKLATNLIKPTGGEVELFGEKLTNKSYEILKRMGTIIEYPVFYEKLTAKQNLDLHCDYMGFHNKKAIDEALELVNLKGIDNKVVKNFSLGMKQRLGIARAILTRPELLILDEPINGLDPVGIKELRDLFKMLCKEYGTTMLISSHILSEIEQIADTIGVISDGRLIEEVTMDTIRNNNTEFIEVACTDCKKAARALDNQLNNMNFKVMNDNILRVYDSRITQKELTKILVMNDIEIESINKKYNSLEDYFLNLINGGLIND